MNVHDDMKMGSCYAITDTCSVKDDSTKIPKRFNLYVHFRFIKMNLFDFILVGFFFQNLAPLYISVHSETRVIDR